MTVRKLHFGDNLDLLRDREQFPSESIDLVYLDPPFNSNRSYNVLFKERDTKPSTAQIEAFEDTWHWTPDTQRLYEDLVTGMDVPATVAKAIDAFRIMLGENDVMAYLVMMTARLLELHRVLKPTGSMYLHCDPTASHSPTHKCGLPCQCEQQAIPLKTRAGTTSIWKSPTCSQQQPV